jgi:hypothetical protein
MTYVAEVEPAVAPETRRGTLSNGLSASGGARLLAPPAGHPLSAIDHSRLLGPSQALALAH